MPQLGGRNGRSIFQANQHCSRALSHTPWHPHIPPCSTFIWRRPWPSVPGWSIAGHHDARPLVVLTTAGRDAGPSNDTQSNDTQSNDSQPNDSQSNDSQSNDSQSNDIPRAVPRFGQERTPRQRLPPPVPQDGKEYLLHVAYGRSPCTQDECRLAVESATVQLGPTTTSRDVSFLLWSTARLCSRRVLHRTDVTVLRLVAALEDTAVQQLATVEEQDPDWNSIDLCQVVHGFTSIGHRPTPQLLCHVLDRTVQCMSQFGCREVASFWYALGKLGVPATHVHALEPLLHHTDVWLSGMTPKQLMHTLLGLAYLKHRPPAAFSSRLLSFTRPYLTSCTAQDFSNLVWSCAKLECHLPHDFVQELSRVAQPRLGEFKSQEYSNLMWGFATMRCDVPQDFITALLAAATPKLHDFSPQGYCNLLYALDVLQCQVPPEFFTAILAAARAKLLKFNMRDYCEMMRSLAALNCAVPDEFVDAVIDAARPKLSCAKHKDLAKLVWAMSVLHYTVPTDFLCPPPSKVPTLAKA